MVSSNDVLVTYYLILNKHNSSIIAKYIKKIIYKKVFLRIC